MLENGWIPDFIKTGLTVKQAEFLCYEGREALFGGAAGPGKSVALLAAALQYIDEPDYNALILRRTYKQLAKADSILGKSKEWLWGKARWSGDDHKWTFPNGNTLEFGHMEHADSMLDYQGGSWAFVGVDECTQFTGPMLAYPRTRLRRQAGSKIPLRWRGASNPGGIGHEYIKERYIKDKDGKSPATADRQFFPARIEDNPNIDRDAYIQSLRDSGVDGFLLEQLLNGNWDAVPGGRFKHEWFLGRTWEWRGTHYNVFNPESPLPRTYEHLLMIVQMVDPAASEKRTSDYTVCSTFGITPRWEVLWLDCLRFQKDIPDIPPILLAEYRRVPGIFNCRIAYMGIEAIASNSAVLQLCQRLPMIVKPLNPMGNDKLVRATAAMTLASTGRIYLPRSAPWVEDAVDELLRFTGDPKKDANDDVVDTVSYMAAELPSLEAGREPQKPYVYSS